MEVRYSFPTRKGSLFLNFYCVDMSECIRFFQRIDPQVRSIQTYIDSNLDTAYHCNSDGEWQASRLPA